MSLRGRELGLVGMRLLGYHYDDVVLLGGYYDGGCGRGCRT
jgi:hypothetical protein